MRVFSPIQRPIPLTSRRVRRLRENSSRVAPIEAALSRPPLEITGRANFSPRRHRRRRDGITNGDPCGRTSRRAPPFARYRRFYPPFSFFSLQRNLIARQTRSMRGGMFTREGVNM